MRFVSVGNVLVDILTRLPELPERGGDVLGSASGMSPGGAYNAMVAASRQGLRAAYAGGHGTGYFGDLIRDGLREHGIEALLAAAPGMDSGYDIALVDDGGERTFVTAFGAEAQLSASQLESVTLEPGDLLHVSGYSLLDVTNGAVLAPWLESVSEDVTVIVDPGPLIADIGRDRWLRVFRRANWISCNEREAEFLIRDDELAALDLPGRGPGIVTRLGQRGCTVAHGGIVVEVPGFPVDAVDTNGAGDAHVGAFAAALAAGLPPADAARRANAAAAIAVSRFGPATAPTLDEVLAFLG
ncbi:MAG TPA: PfkB family carbohydrate kinase [Galbitalea sp.]|jgi:sugar/nucleoside kinase (ribokinase family)|nr:PfkB family carbohydrate kinase [Galbitalea sp.]